MARQPGSSRPLTRPSGSFVELGVLASHLRLPKKQVAVWLTRICEGNGKRPPRCADARIEVPNPRAGEPLYLYRTCDVWPLALAWLEELSN